MVLKAKKMSLMNLKMIYRKDKGVVMVEESWKTHGIGNDSIYANYCENCGREIMTGLKICNSCYQEAMERKEDETEDDRLFKE